MKRASSLTYKTLDGTYVVQYGTLNEKFNVKFTDKINLAIKGATICFNVITVHDRKIVVDCQSADDNMDVMYVIDEVDQSVKGYPFSNTTITTSTTHLIQRERASLSPSREEEPSFCQLSCRTESTPHNKTRHLSPSMRWIQTPPSHQSL